MTSEAPARSRVSIIRVTAILVVMIAAVLGYSRVRSQPLLEVCENAHHDPVPALEACDAYLNALIFIPSESVSLIHRHKMRAYMKQEDWEAAQLQVDLAIAADPVSPVPWQWKAKAFLNSADYRAALQAIDKSLTLKPDNAYSLKTKHKLLMLLEEYKIIDDMISRKWINGEVAHWLPSDGLQEITWNPSRFPKSQAAFLNFTLALRGDLISDLHNHKLRKKFTMYCRLLAANCPPLLPDRRESYLKAGCEKAIRDFEEQRQEVKDTIDRLGYQSLGDLVQMEPRRRAAPIIQARYLATVTNFEHNPTAEVSKQLIVDTRAFNCVLNGKFVTLSGGFHGSLEENTREAENLFNKTLRLNLLDLAYVYAN